MSDSIETPSDYTTIDIEASSETVYELVAELRGAGLILSWNPIDETRNEFLEAVSASIVAAGSYDLIKAILAKFTDRTRKLSASRRVDTAPSVEDNRPSADS